MRRCPPRSWRTAVVAFALTALAGCASDTGTTADTNPPGVTFATIPVPATIATTPTAPLASVPADTTPTTPAGIDTTPTEPAAGTEPVSVPATEAPTPAITPDTTTVAPDDPAVALQPIASLDQPLDIAWRTGDTTMYVVEQAGRIVPVRDGVVGDPVLDITDRTSADGEQGLLGLTFSPDGAFAYVDYTDNSGDTVIAEYPVADDGTMRHDGERVVLQIDQPYANHNGGNVMFGPDGYLYIGMGDGGAANDPERRALNVGSLLGKILRIDPEPAMGNPYSSPPDNPFVNVAGARPEIWSVGVRNPWRMSFDAPTGDLWIADVGQGAWEEIDVARAADGGGRGLDFGWSAWEGTHRFNQDQPADGMTPPVYEYAHGDAGCSVSGGAVYRGTSIPALVGWYVFGDYCSGNIVGLRVDGTTLVDSILFANLPGVGAVRVAPDGELFAVSLAGDLVQLVAG